MNSNRQPSFASFTIPLAFKTIPVCLLIFIILTVGDPDLLDAIIKLILSYAK